ncbi:MAG TPA: hypothetical protein VN648_15185 [Candidatus Methylomirabilis sp.]|nr:hypothetical protein [Candidatus Methylomirabilis sp.]
MKFVTINTLAPGVDNARKALATYGKAGLPPGTEATWAATDGKTFISVIESDSPDMTLTATYAPFFEKSVVMPVVALDDKWLQAIQAAEANWP